MDIFCNCPLLIIRDNSFVITADKSNMVFSTFKKCYFFKLKDKGEYFIQPSQDNFLISVIVNGKIITSNLLKIKI